MEFVFFSIHNEVCCKYAAVHSEEYYNYVAAAAMEHGYLVSNIARYGDGKKVREKSEIFDEARLDENAQVCFIFYERFPFSFDRDYLAYIRDKYPNGILCLVFSNCASTCDSNVAAYEAMQDLYDFAITFNQADAQKYGFKYYPCDLGVFSLPEMEMPSGEYKSDLFFAGVNKGRLPLLLEIYEEMTKRGFVCDFHITQVPEEEQQYKDKIHYNCYLPYDQVIEGAAKSRAILEILVNHENYCSLRTNEAIRYNKYLITTNQTVFKEDFYHPDWVNIISGAEDIDYAMFAPERQMPHYETDWGSVERFCRFLLREIEADHKNMRSGEELPC